MLRPDEIVKKILTIRGIVSEEDVSEFLSDEPKLTYDPLSLPGAEAGADFLLGSISRGERVCVYGDYDVDGICGTALLVSFLREAARALGSDSRVSYYIPSRMDEGYGLNKSAIRAIKGSGADVIVTVDCGSVNVAEAAYAREIGLEIIITDHHDPDAQKQPDCIHINPKIKSADETGESGGNKGRPAAAYPFEKLSGAGVAFKLCGALLARAETPEIQETLRAKLRSCVDLVCIATIADVMPIIDENRTFVKYGLRTIKRGQRLALREALATACIDPAKLDVHEVAFGVAPRLNALGRLGDASEGVELFLTEDENRIREIARRMNELNIERRRIQDDCLKECEALFNADLGADGKPRLPFLLLRPGSAHEGIAGIVAGKVRDETGFPCAVLSETQENKKILKGSARGGGGLDLISFLRRHESLFEQLGGHAAAAGFLIREENEKPLREALSRDLAEALAAEPDLLKEKREAELEIERGDVTPALAEAIGKLAPFGNGNPKPALSLRVAPEDIEGFRRMGREGRHLRFTADGLPCVFFWGADTVFAETGTIRITGCPEMNEWNGYENIQFAVAYVDML